MHATTPTGQIVLSLNVLVDKCRKKWFELKEAVSLFCNIKQEDKVMGRTITEQRGKGNAMARK